VFSSIHDEAVFPFYYVAMFAEKLKNLKYDLDDKQISKFVYNVMQYGDIVKKDGGECELNEFCNLAMGKMLRLSYDEQTKRVSNMAQKYLEIRNEYLALQTTYLQNLQKEYSINLFGINDAIRKNNKQVRENFCKEANKIFTKEFGVDATKPSSSIRKQNTTANSAHSGDIGDCPYV
jgi:hypothetical protein